ncbi:AMP-binding protein [Micromonospora sp. WMMD998]|uniref:AMP-binding protein n=1 Tax=Micromonospora sp. WMMD998 TaxID=3016092 RepID=UPI00249C5F21|nr:AMP-binding protein [Micromonospora sp. WMMD998]WFE41023.1 AMP-binding protein [Micromonospora sp. WMMD998]
MSSLAVSRDLLLGWLDAPSTERGVRFHVEGPDWSRHTYEDLAERALRAGAALADAGVRRGEVVPLVLPSGPDFVACFFGLLAIGATPSVLPLPAALQDTTGYETQLRAIAAAVRPRFAIASDDHRDVLLAGVRQAGQQTTILAPAYGDVGAAPRAHGELAVLQFTSGSLGRPQGVRITVDNLAANLRMIQRWLGITDRGGVSWLPLYHDMGLVGGLLTLVTLQTEHAMMRPQQFVRDTRGWLAEYGSGRYAQIFMPNFGFERVVDRVTPDDLVGLDFSGVTSVVSGAERINPAALARFAALLQPHGFDSRALTPAYGLAEGTLAVTGVPRHEPVRMVRTNAPGRSLDDKVEVTGKAVLTTDPVSEPWGWQVSCGRPLDGLRVDVVDEDGQPQPDGVFGEISVQGPSITAGYADGTSRDGARLVGGSLRTGDAGFFHDGDLYVVGRLGDSVKLRGRSIFVEDVELDLRARTGIAPRHLVVAGGVVDGRPTLLVVAERDLGDHLDVVVEAVRAFTGSAVRVLILRARRGTIPLTSSGKPRRRLLWRRHLAGQLTGEWLGDPPAPSDTDTDTDEQIREAGREPVVR